MQISCSTFQFDSLCRRHNFAAGFNVYPAEKHFYLFLTLCVTLSHSELRFKLSLMGIFIHFSSIISWGAIFKLHYLENYSFLEKKKSTQSQFKFHGYIQRLGNMSHCFGFTKYNRCWRDTETTPITVGSGSAGDHRPSLSPQPCPLHFLIAWNGTSDPFRLHR